MKNGKIKKILCILFVVALLTFCGCSKGNNASTSAQQEDGAKSCKIEVLSAQDDTLLKAIDDQETVNKFITPDKWESAEKLPEDLIPEYKLVVYQEKTLLAGQDPSENREFEVIENITTYQNSSYVEFSISGDVVKNMEVPDEFLTTVYIVPDDFINDLQELLQQ